MDTERLAFERWYRHRYAFSGPFGKDASDSYVSAHTRTSFEAWQARPQDSRCGELLATFNAIAEKWRNTAEHDPEFRGPENADMRAQLRICADELTKAIAAFEVGK